MFAEPSEGGRDSHCDGGLYNSRHYKGSGMRLSKIIFEYLGLYWFSQMRTAGIASGRVKAFMLPVVLGQGTTFNRVRLTQDVSH